MKNHYERGQHIILDREYSDGLYDDGYILKYEFNDDNQLLYTVSYINHDTGVSIIDQNVEEKELLAYNKCNLELYPVRDICSIGKIIKGDNI